LKPVPAIKESSAFSNARAPRDRQSGQSLVELALLLPFLALLLAGIVDLGRGFRVLTLITSAASQGAQYGTFNPNDASGIRTRVTNALEGSGVVVTNANACPDICITFPGGSSAGQPVRVQVQHQLDTILGAILGFGAIPIQGANQAIIF
jgi:Flp pilus assembly protein TadG